MFLLIRFLVLWFKSQGLSPHYTIYELVHSNC